jgi:hypothetical protein
MYVNTAPVADKVLLVHVAKSPGWNSPGWNPHDRNESLFLGRDREELEAGSVLMETERKLFQPLLQKCEENGKKCEMISRLPRNVLQSERARDRYGMSTPPATTDLAHAPPVFPIAAVRVATRSASARRFSTSARHARRTCW